MSKDNDLKTEILLAISSRLNRAENLEDFLQSIADVAANLTQSEGSSFLLFEEETQQLYFAAAVASNREKLLKLRVPIDQSVAGHVYSYSQPLVIPDAQTASQIYRTIEQSMDMTTRNLLAVPVTFSDATFGTLEVINKLEGQSYTPEDQTTLEILASYAGTAIQQDNLLKEAEEVTREREELKRQKNDFVAIASHELRTPLGLVLGHATFLREMAEEEFLHDQLDAIVRNAEKLKIIIDSLNQAENFQSRNVSIRWQHIDLNPVLQGLIDSFKEEAEKRQIKLFLDLPPERALIRCDTAKLRVAIGNVIKNALVFSEDGGSVHVCLKKLPGYVRISVEDTGIGIPPEDLHRIFQRFYQVEPHLTRKHGGIGLGLAVTKDIVESHAGQIWVESTLGEGSTFTILLPTDNPAFS